MFNADYVYSTYVNLLQEMGLAEGDSYNLLLTPRLMWIVKRCQNSVEDLESGSKIDVNSLGFAGTLFVKNEVSLNYLKSFGLINTLRQVAAKL